MVPPAIPGLGATGGLQLQLEDRNNLGATEMQRAVETLMENYRNYPALASVSSQYQANVPQYFLNGHTVEQCFHGFRVLYGRSLR